MEWMATQITKANINAFEPLMDDRSKNKLLSQKDTFGIGAVSENRACGALIYSFDGEFISIICLSVADEYRRKKVGTFLMDTICRLAYDNTIPILIDFYTDGNPDLDERWHFFSSLNGFSANLSDARVYGIDISDVEKAIAGKLPKGERNVKPLYFAKQDKKEQQCLLSHLGVTAEIIGSDKQIIPELCMYLKKDDEPTAAVFVSCGDDLDSGEIEISYLWGENPNTIVVLLTFFLDTLAQLSGDYKKLLMATVNQRSDRLANYLLGEEYVLKQGVSVVWDMDDFPLPYSGE